MKRRAEHVPEGEKSKEQKIVDLGYFNRIGVDITKSIIRLMIENNYDEKYKIPHICRTFKEYYILDEEFRLDCFFKHDWPYALSLVLYSIKDQGEIGFFTKNERSHIYFDRYGSLSGYEFHWDGTEWTPQILERKPEDLSDDQSNERALTITKYAMERKMKHITRIAYKIWIQWYTGKYSDSDDPDEREFIKICFSRGLETFDGFKNLLFPKYRGIMIKQIQRLISVNARDDSKPANRYF